MMPEAVLLAVSVALAPAAAGAPGSGWFRHHYIARAFPGENLGLGGMGVADFDRDGDLDVVVLNRGDTQVYWFENDGGGGWVRHRAGGLPRSQLGMLVADVDGDGWVDAVFGGVWLGNPRKPRQEPFDRRVYDSRIRSEIHDLASADINGDGQPDVVALGDREGLLWYSPPGGARADSEWQRNVITLDVLDQNADIHGGFAPGGIGDLDGDGDPDVVLAGRWMENQASGSRWAAHRMAFGRRGPWGVSARSWVEDVDGDGDNDIVMADCDGQNSGVAWLENNGKRPPGFRVHYLALRAPGTRGSFHSLWYADFDGDGRKDILVAEQEDPTILPLGAAPRWYIFRRLAGSPVGFEEQVILDAKLGGHDLRAADLDGDGDLDIVSKVWSVWEGNGNGGRPHLDWLENLTRRPAR